MEATRLPAPAKRPFHVLIATAAVGLAMAEAEAALIGLAAVAAVALLACLRAPKLGAIAGSLILAGAMAGDWRLQDVDGAASRVGHGDRVDIRAHLLTAPRPGPFGASAEVGVADGVLSGARLLLRVPRWSPLPASARPGAELRLEGRTARIAAGATDFAAHLRRRGIAGELLLDRAELTGKRRGGAAGLLDRLRARAERGVTAGMEPDHAALLRGMVLGQDERIGQAVREDFRASGLAHLLSYIRQGSTLHDIGLDGYIRVSRRAGREGESFISPDVQREQIAAWAKLRGVEIAKWHEDIDVSGGKLERPGLDALMARIESGETGGVAVARLDRLSRAGVADALKLVERIHDHGGQVAAVDLGIDPETPFGEFGMTLMLALARMERRRITDSWDNARERAVSRGVHVASRCPTGYVRREDGRLEPHPTDGPVVAELFRRRADGASWTALCDHLNEHGVEGPYSSTFWTTRPLQHMVANRVYLGEARSGRHTNVNAHEPLIDLGTWEAAQRARGVSSPRNGEGAVLAGLLRCAGCRHLLKPDSIRDRNGEKLRTYRCRGKHSTGLCEDRSAVLERVVLPVVEDAMFGILGATRLKELDESQDLSELEFAVQVADAELVAYRDDERIEGALGADRFVEGLEKRAAEVDEATRRLAEARAAIPAEESIDLQEAWPAMSVASKKALLARVFDAVMLRSGRNREIGDRLWFLLRGTAPEDLPRRGKRYPLKPFEFEDLSVEEGTDLVRRTRETAHEGVLR